MRKILPLITTLGILTVAVTGCAAQSTPVPVISSGPASDLVKASGEFGDAPRIDFPTPLHTETTECTVLIEGEGPTLVDGQAARIAFSLRNATTGEEIEEAGFTTEPLTIALAEQTLALPGFVDGLTCASEGSRVAIAIAPNDGFGQNAPGLSADDSLVVVADVIQAFAPRAEGTPQIARDGFPSVVLAPDGRPGITVPKTDPFDTLQVSLLRAGNGKLLEEGDNVIVHFTAVAWNDNRVLDSTWSKGFPALVPMGDGPVPGFSAALDGQRVGSQVIAVIPPEDESGSPAESTRVYVIDILGAY